MYPLRLVQDLRPVLPWSIYELPINIPGNDPELHGRRFAVLWDEDNDPRVLAAVLAAYYANEQSVWPLYAVAERKASLTIFLGELPDGVEATWRKAASSPAISDAWDLEIVTPMDEIRRTGGLESLSLRAAGHYVRTFPREHDDLNALTKLYGLGSSSARRPWNWP